MTCPPAARRPRPSRGLTDRSPQDSTIRANSCFTGFDFGALPAPSASPRVPEERQSNSAQVVCLCPRLFRVTVKNQLRIWLDGGESCLRAGIRLLPGPAGRPTGQVVATLT